MQLHRQGRGSGCALARTQNRTGLSRGGLVDTLAIVVSPLQVSTHEPIPGAEEAPFHLKNRTRGLSLVKLSSSCARYFNN